MGEKRVSDMFGPSDVTRASLDIGFRGTRGFVSWKEARFSNPPLSISDAALTNLHTHRFEFLEDVYTHRKMPLRRRRVAGKAQ